MYWCGIVVVVVGLLYTCAYIRSRAAKTLTLNEDDEEEDDEDDDDVVFVVLVFVWAEDEDRTLLSFLVWVIYRGANCFGRKKPGVLAFRKIPL